jgi:hypothetical protein
MPVWTMVMASVRAKLVQGSEPVVMAGRGYCPTPPITEFPPSLSEEAVAAPTGLTAWTGSVSSMPDGGPALRRLLGHSSRVSDDSPAVCRPQGDESAFA